MIVTNTVAIRRYADAGHGFHETRGQTPQTAVAQSRIRLQFADEIDVHVQFRQRFADAVGQLQVIHGVAQQATNQKFEREVVHALFLSAVVFAGGRHPAIHDVVAHDQNGGGQPIAAVRSQRVFADRVGELR